MCTRWVLLCKRVIACDLSEYRKIKRSGLTWRQPRESYRNLMCDLREGTRAEGDKNDVTPRAHNCATSGKRQWVKKWEKKCDNMVVWFGDSLHLREVKRETKRKNKSTWSSSRVFYSRYGILQEHTHKGQYRLHALLFSWFCLSVSKKGACRPRELFNDCV